VKCLHTGEVYREKYDALVLSPGSAPIRPPLQGIDLPEVFVLHTIPDSRLIRSWIEQRKAERAVIIGGGYIGLEMAENLTALGISVTVVQRSDQVLRTLDPEMAVPVHEHLIKNGVSLHLFDTPAAFEQSSTGSLVVKTNSGACLPADLVILAIGVRPEIKLAKDAGLTIGERGGIRVNEQMRTSDPNIWAVGDAVETRNIVTGEWGLLPLAGPANRQGRLAADSICGQETFFRGVQGTAVCGLFGLTVATTGANEKTLCRLGITGYQKVYLHPSQHVAYYPGASPIHMKLLFAGDDSRILGAQALGQEDVEKQIDVIAMAIQNGASVFDLEEAEVCCAPQFGAAKDPVNLAGMIASNVLREDV
jgi:NADPH-dependent 2,4-dienoyl-CoA reductase/sulfur reductase-like enzyme